MRRLVEVGADLQQKNAAGKTAFDLLPGAPNADEKALVAVMDTKDLTTSCLHYLNRNHNALWFWVLQLSPDKSSKKSTKEPEKEGKFMVRVGDLSIDVPHFVEKVVQLDPSMAFAADKENRKAQGIATTVNFLAINAVLLWHGKYQVEPEPEHTSATCFVFKVTSPPRAWI